MATALSIRAQLAGNYATLVKADAPVGWWRLGDSEGYAQAVLSDGAIGYWRMDAPSGTVETDRSGFGHNMTYFGSFTLGQAGALGDGDAAVLLPTDSAANGAISSATALDTSGTKHYTLEGWVYLRQAPVGNETIFGQHYTPAGVRNGAFVYITPGRAIQTERDCAGTLDSTSSSAIPLNTWTHVAVTYDGLTITLYVNGVAANSSVSSGSMTWVPGATGTSSSTTNYYVGNITSLAGAPNAIIDEVAVYSYTLTAQQIANHYALRTSTIATVGYAAAADSSGNGLTGLVNGGITLQQATNQPDLNTAALFDGNTGYVSVPAAAVLAPTAAVSVEAWVNTTSTSAPGAILEKTIGGVVNTSYLLFQEAGSWRFRVSIVAVGIVTVATPVTAADVGAWVHLVGTFDGLNLRLYRNGVLMDTSALSVGAVSSGSGVLLIGALGGTIFLLSEKLDEVAVYSYALTAAQVQAHYLSGFWTDLTGDLTDAPIRVTRGFQSNAPDDLVAAPAALQFSVDNSVHNSGSTRSWYSPDFSGKRTGWQTGIRLQCRVTANGTTRTRFDGWLDVTTPLAGLYQDQTVACLAVGWLAHAATTLAVGLTAQISKRADQLIPALVALVPFQPPAMAIATGLDTFPVAFDDLDPTTSTVNDALDSIVKSGFDRLYEKADGTLVYETRWTREMPATNVLTLTDLSSSPTPGLALTAVPAERRRDAIRNRFQVTVHPRRLDAAAVVLYALQISATTAAIPPGATVTFVGTFVDPTQLSQQIGGFNTLISDGGAGSVIGTSGSLPTADFGFGSVAGGSDLSASCLVTVAYEIGQVTFTVTNNAAVPAIPSKLQCRGQGIYNYQTVTATEADLSSQGIVGQSTVTLNCPYQADPYFAQAAAFYGLNLYGPSLTQLDQGVQAFVNGDDEVSMDTLLQREVSDAIAVTETMTGLNAGNYWINAFVEEYDERTNATFTLMLTPRDTTTYFTVDVSTLDGPDVLAAI